MVQHFTLSRNVGNSFNLLSISNLYLHIIYCTFSKNNRKLYKLTHFTLCYCQDKTGGKIEASQEPLSLLCKLSSEWKEHSKSSSNKDCNYGANRLFSAPQKNNGLSLLCTLFLNHVTSEADGLITWVRQCKSDLASQTSVMLCPVGLLYIQ